MDPQPGLDSRQRSGRPAWPIVIGVGVGAVVIGIVVAALLGQRPPSDGAASSSVAADPSASAIGSPASPSASAVPEPTMSGAPTTAAELTWTTAGVFGTDTGLSWVADVAALDDGLVAVGAQLDGYPPALGPGPASQGRVWSSTDGRSWQDVTPDGAFDNFTPGHLLVRADGSLLVLGMRDEMSDVPSPQWGHTAWKSPDGISWTEAPSGLPPSLVYELTSGDRGHVAQLVTSPNAEDTELWHSGDGVTWQQTLVLPYSTFDVGAGDEGFVAAGQYHADPANPTPLVVASGDGMTWFESATAQPGARAVAPLGGDWVVVSAPDAIGSAQTWFSANGLDWTQHGTVPLEPDVDGSGCFEFPNGLSAAGGLLVLSTTLGACSEGGVYVHATLLTSRDGATWSAVDFERGTPGEFWSGAGVRAAIAVEGGAVLVGEEDGRATFWFGEGS